MSQERSDGKDRYDRRLKYGVVLGVLVVTALWLFFAFRPHDRFEETMASTTTPASTSQSAQAAPTPVNSEMAPTPASTPDSAPTESAPKPTVPAIVRSKAPVDPAKIVGVWHPTDKAYFETYGFLEEFDSYEDGDHECQGPILSLPDHRVIALKQTIRYEEASHQILYDCVTQFAFHRWQKITIGDVLDNSTDSSSWVVQFQRDNGELVEAYEVLSICSGENACIDFKEVFNAEMERDADKARSGRD